MVRSSIWPEAGVGTAVSTNLKLSEAGSPIPHEARRILAILSRHRAPLLELNWRIG
jgi:hypothetical protein